MRSRVEEKGRIPKGAGYALALVGLGNVMCLLDRNILAILAPQIKADLHIGNAEMGLLSGTVFSLFYALFSLPLGRLSDGWWRNKLLAISITVWSLATGLAAVASGFAMMALSRLWVGIGEASMQPAGTSLAFDYWPKERRGFVMAVLGAAIAVGLGGSNVLGGFAASWWDGQFGGAAPMGLKGWQFAFVAAAAPGFILALLFWWLREPARGAIDGLPAPEDPDVFRASGAVLGNVVPGFHLLAFARHKASGRLWATNLLLSAAIILACVMVTHTLTAYFPRPTQQFGSFAVNPHALQWTIVGFGLLVIINLLHSLSLTDKPAYAIIMRSPSLLLAMAAGSLQTFINYGIMFFTPQFLMQQYGKDMREIGLFWGLLSAGLGIIGPMISGPLSDIINKRAPGKGRIWVTLFALGVSPRIAFWLYHAPDINSFYLRFIPYSLVLTMWLPPLYAAMYDQVLPRMRGIVTSFYLLLTTILGLGIGPYVVGLMADANQGKFQQAILNVNWVGPAIVICLVLLAIRIQRDEAGVIDRARAAGEPV